MSSGRQRVSGISSRRSACDRCRFSKARCIRQDPGHTRCDWCLRTNSECVTSPIFRLRAWQPPGIRDHGRNGQLDNGQARASSHQQLFPTPSESDFGTDLPLGVVSSGEIQGPAGGASLDLAGGLGWASNLAMSGHPDSVYQGNGLGDPMEAESYAVVEGIFDFNFPQTFSTPTPPEGSSAFDGASLPSSSSGTIDPATTETTPQFRENCAPHSSELHHRSAPGSLEMDAGQTPVQRLSKFDYDLITLLIRLDQGPPQVTMETLVKAADNSPSVVDNIIDKTTHFIELLRLLASGRPPPSNSPSNATARQGSNKDSPGVRARSCTADSSDYSSDDESLGQTPSTGVHDALPSALSSPAARHDLGIPCYLLVLSAYIRLLRLFLIIFSHVFEHLEDLSKGDNPHLCPVPGLGISSFPIQSGNLQTLVLIQIVTSLFETIEGLLGLPRELRISRHRGDQSGLLSAPEIAGLALSILEKEKGGRPENGEGGIKALRKYMGKTKRLLRATIAP